MAGSDVGKRLARYLGDGPGKRMSIRAFAEEMKSREPRPPGSSRAMVHRYLAGTAPPADFIFAAADVLGLRRDWLAFGEGEPTEGEQREAAQDVTESGPDELTGRRIRMLRDRFPGLGSLPYAVAGALVRHVDMWANRQPRGPEGLNLMEHARLTWLGIVEPFPPEHPPADYVAFEMYVTAAIHARNLALLVETYTFEPED